MEYLGACLYKSGTRILHKVFRSGKQAFEAVSWADKRCSDCGRFISRFNGGKRCRPCYELSIREFSRLRYLRLRLDPVFKSNQRLRNKIYKHADQFKIGDYIYWP